MLKKGLIEMIQDCRNSDEMRGKYRRGIEQHPRMENVLCVLVS